MDKQGGIPCSASKLSGMNNVTHASVSIHSTVTCRLNQSAKLTTALIFAMTVEQYCLNFNDRHFGKLNLQSISCHGTR